MLLRILSGASLKSRKCRGSGVGPCTPGSSSHRTTVGIRVPAPVFLLVLLTLLALLAGSCRKTPQTYKIFAGKEGYTHKISEGETLEEIAERYYQNPALGKALGEYNGLDPTEPLVPGTTLLVPFDTSELLEIQTLYEANVLYNKGTMLARTGQYEEAVRYLEGAVADSPAHVDAWFNLALVYNKLEQYEEAREILQRLANSFPADATYRYGLGASFRGLARKKDAVRQFEKALEIDPEYREAQYALAITYQGMGKWRKAAGAWKRYLEIDPDSAWSEEARLHLKQLERR
jgi:tetratricopeptide (TPR) repeat protein